MGLIDAISDSVTQCLLLLFFRKHLVTLDLLKVLGSRLMPAEGVECVDTQRTLKRKQLFGSECRDNSGDFLCFLMRQYLVRCHSYVCTAKYVGTGDAAGER